MKQIVEILKSILGVILRFLMARRTIAIRAAFSVAYGVVGGLLAFALLILGGLQVVAALILLKPLGAITSLSHVLTVYLYKIFRYLTMNEAARPWPLGAFPAELEPSERVDVTNPGAGKPQETEAAETPSDSDHIPEPAEATPAGEAEAGEEDTQEAIILDHKQS
ncbi:MAG: DUF4389 domain-containing protein [Desulfococcaceae bacterium]